MTEPSSGRETPMRFLPDDYVEFGGVRDGTGRVANPLLDTFAPRLSDRRTVGWS